MTTCERCDAQARWWFGSPIRGDVRTVALCVPHAADAIDEALADRDSFLSKPIEEETP